MTDTELEKKYEDLLDKHLDLIKELDRDHRDFQKIRDILRTKTCDGHCGLCRIFERGCLVYDERRNIALRPSYDPFP
jgi:hypothetical protein